MARTVLVTGGAGFIGSHVARALLDRGDRVVCLDNLDPFYDEGLKRENLAACAGERFSFAQGDIRDTTLVRRVMDESRPSCVVHLAARAGVRPSIADPIGYADVNVTGTSVVLDACARAGVRRVVVASSSSVYGDAPRVPFREDDEGIMPISPYAATKRATEMVCHAHWHLTRMPTACLRFFTVYGPRQRPDLAICKFMRKIAQGEAIELYGDGTSSRDYTYIDDIVAGVLSAMERVDRFGFRVWNLGSDSPVMLNELVSRIEEVVGRAARVARVGRQAGDVARTWADLSRSRAELGYSPRVSLEDGLRAQWGWMRDRVGDCVEDGVWRADNGHE